MNYLKEIQALESEAFRKPPLCQLTIDILQETEMELNRDESQEPIERDEIGAMVYGIHCLLVMVRPELTNDIEVLNRLCDILVKWRDDIEFVNRTLGIPLHRG